MKNTCLLAASNFLLLKTALRGCFYLYLRKFKMPFLWVLAGFLPFVSWGRVAPIASFWPQWSAATIFLVVCMIHLFANRHCLRFASRNSYDAPVVVLIFAILIQIIFGHIYSQASAVMAVGVLLLGWIFAKTTGASIAERPEKNMDFWCVGVIGALVFQFFIVGLGVFRKDFIYGSFVDLPTLLRAFGAFGQSNQLGVFSALALACVYHLFFKRKIAEIVVWVCVAISALNCALSYSRAALVVWFAMTLVTAIPLWRVRCTDEGFKKRWRVYLYTSVLFVSIQVLNFLMPLMPLVAGIQEGQSVLAGNRSFSANARWEQIRDSMELIGNHAFYGVGYEGFAGSRLKDLHGSLSEPETTVPHNLFFQLFVEFGWAGVVIFLCLTVSVLKSLRSIVVDFKEYSSSLMLALQWVVGLYVYSMFEFPLLYSYFLLPFMMMTGVVGSQANVKLVEIGGKAKAFLISVLLMGFGLLGLLASDYQRLYTFFHGDYSKVSAGGKIDNSFFADLSKIQSSSMFQFHVNYIWLSVVALNDAFIDEKLEVADFVMRGVPQYQTISIYSAYLVIGKKGNQAMEFLEEFSRRNPGEFKKIVLELEKMAKMKGTSTLLNDFLTTPSFEALKQGRAKYLPTDAPEAHALPMDGH